MFSIKSNFNRSLEYGLAILTWPNKCLKGNHSPKGKSSRIPLEIKALKIFEYKIRQEKFFIQRVFLQP